MNPPPPYAEPMLLDVAPGPLDSSSPVALIVAVVLAVVIIAIIIWAVLRKRPPRA